MAAPSSIKPLNSSELDFVDNFVSSKFLHELGTPTGFNEFCKLAVRTGALKTCANGTKRNKQAYATYLKAAELWTPLMKKYNGLDAFTKQGMAKQVTKGNGLSSAVKGKIEGGEVFGGCLYGKQTVAQLKKDILNEDDTLESKDLVGLKKAELCSLLDSLMGGEDAKGLFTLQSNPGASIAYTSLPGARKSLQAPKSRQQKSEAAYLKKYIPAASKTTTKKSDAQLFKELLAGEVSDAFQ